MEDGKKQKKRAGPKGAKERMHKLLAHIENRFQSESGKASVTDYVRLLQLEQELDEGESPRDLARAAFGD